MLWLSTITKAVLWSFCKCGVHTMSQEGWAVGSVAARQARKPFCLVEPHMCHGGGQQDLVALSSSPAHLQCSQGRGLSHAAHFHICRLAWFTELFRFQGEATFGRL